MVIVSLLTGVVGPLPNGLFMGYKWELLFNMILQVGSHKTFILHGMFARSILI